jgi:hypothetical protein
MKLTINDTVTIKVPMKYQSEVLKLVHEIINHNPLQRPELFTPQSLPILQKHLTNRKPRTKKTHKFWSIEEEKDLEVDWNNRSTNNVELFSKAIADKYKRSYKSVYTRLYKLGLIGPKKN